MLFLFELRGDGLGMKFVILLSGSLNLDGGANGGFLSVEALFVWFEFDIDDELVEESEAKALFSCFNLVFLSSASWFSRSRTWSVSNKRRPRLNHRQSSFPKHTSQ